ncbi:hypothetical protein MMYC01_209873 [Madurella mycetomatis]|uniref:Uncharacterized protein n=1 Tax=Madurella mycetomatis TaxID=100816 RepID=A0A175VPC5_9PEZI|nr:hypothetical protein MMYC01_209873 [Madurella mycetomatis]
MAIERTATILQRPMAEELRKLAAVDPGKRLPVLILHGDSDAGMPLETSSAVVHEILPWSQLEGPDWTDDEEELIARSRVASEDTREGRLGPTASSDAQLSGSGDCSEARTDDELRVARRSRLFPRRRIPRPAGRPGGVVAAAPLVPRVVEGASVPAYAENVDIVGL